MMLTRNERVALVMAELKVLHERKDAEYSLAGGLTNYDEAAMFGTRPYEYAIQRMYEKRARLEKLSKSGDWTKLRQELIDIVLTGINAIVLGDDYHSKDKGGS